MQRLPLFQRGAEYGEAIAIRTARQEHSYRELLDRSSHFAARLLESETDLREKRVAFLVPAGPDYLLAQWGIWRAGGVAVPLSRSATDVELPCRRFT